MENRRPHLILADIQKRNETPITRLAPQERERARPAIDHIQLKAAGLLALTKEDSENFFDSTGNKLHIRNKEALSPQISGDANLQIDRWIYKRNGLGKAVSTSMQVYRFYPDATVVKNTNDRTNNQDAYGPPIHFPEEAHEVGFEELVGLSDVLERCVPNDLV